MGNKSVLDSRQKMLEINVRQKVFYESRFEAAQKCKPTAEQAANLPTNMWTWMRHKVHSIRRSIGVDEQVDALHREWMRNLRNAYVLDLGCFAGNPLSLWIAENCKDYTGIDLSERETASAASSSCACLRSRLSCQFLPG